MFVEGGQNTGTGIGAWAGSQKYSKLEKLVRHFKEGRQGSYMFGVRMRSLTWSVHLERPLMAWRARGQMGYSGGEGVQEALLPWHLKGRRGAAWWSGNKGGETSHRVLHRGSLLQWAKPLVQVRFKTMEPNTQLEGSDVNDAGGHGVPREREVRKWGCYFWPFSVSKKSLKSFQSKTGLKFVKSQLKSAGRGKVMKGLSVFVPNLGKLMF